MKTPSNVIVAITFSRPQYDRLVRICEYLNTTPQKLVHGGVEHEMGQLERAFYIRGANVCPEPELEAIDV